MKVKTDKPFTTQDLVGALISGDYPAKHKKEYTITIDPLPKNCYECPFYIFQNKDEETQDYYCLFGSINISGIAIKRAKDCPL